MHTLKRKAYLSPYASLKAGDIATATTAQLQAALCIYDHEPPKDYILVGDCEITVHTHATSDIVGSAVAALRAAQQELRAKSALADTRLEGEIQSLLSLTHSKEN
jgi:hypothetical protein